ncbi:MAG: tatA [Pseudonocardiales bacterium]|nr:tatA [Pseudonocardiales bacterium]
MGLGLEQPSHWLIIAVLALLLFGYKKLPEMARSAGKSMRIFKTELKGMASDDEVRDQKAVPAEAAAAPPAPIVAPIVAEPAPPTPTPVVAPAVAPVVAVAPALPPEAAPAPVNDPVTHPAS